MNINDKNHLEDFYINLYKNINEGFLEIRPFKDGKPTESRFLPINDFEHNLITTIDDLINNHDVYYGISTRKTNENGKKENCQFLPAIFLDIDVGTLGHNKRSFFDNKNQAIEHLSRLQLNPTAIIDSGHGIHVYWFFEAPIELTNLAILQAEEIMKKLQLVCGGDTVKDVSRILRVPYSYNLKKDRVCSFVLTSDYGNRTSIEKLEEGFNKSGFSKLYSVLNKSEELKNLVFGIVPNGIEDRSAVDQKIISRLVLHGFNDDEINKVFNYFPTTGKYFERKAEDISGADKYLNHSINKARDYVAPSQVLMQNINLGIESNSRYRIVEEGEECGYYLKTSSDDCEWKKLTNFVIKLDEQITANYNNKPDTYFNGKVSVSGITTFRFERLSASLFASQQKFDEYLHQLCGVKIHISGYFKQLIDVIKEHNRSINIVTAIEFGYNEQLTEYRTGECIIRASDVIIEKTPIMYSNEWRKNKVGFKTEIDTSLIEVKNIIIERLFKWDDYKISLLCFSFVMLALLYPFIKNYVEGKPYLLVTGDSGSGKTTVSRFYQAFFGQFSNLFPATSTATALNVAGHAMKDTLFCIDDLKISAMGSDAKRNAFMSTIQNYSDGNSRNRSSVNLEILDEKDIRGLLMINGEDLVMTEASTIARGIILYLNKKEPKNAEVRFLSESSKQFSFYTLNFIQYLLGKKDSIDFGALVDSNIKCLLRMSDEANLSGENLPRIINNLALLKTAWDISKKFLFADVLFEAEDYDSEFNRGLRDILIDNFHRAHRFKADEKFEDILWTLISNKSLVVQNSEQIDEEKKNNTIGIYKQNEDGSIALGISLRVAYKEVNDFLRSEGGLGIQFESLKNRLVENRKIKLPKGKTATIGGKQVRGVYWHGEIPKEVLGISTFIEINNSTAGLGLVPTEKLVEEESILLN